MNKTMIKRKHMIFGIIAVLVIAFTIPLLNPLRRSDEKIKESLLKLTPIGMDMEDVINIIESNKKWEIEYISYDHGYAISGGEPREPSSYSTTVIGVKSIRVYLGGYKSIFTADVSAWWGFDENSKLVGVDVRKDIDSI